MYDKSGLAVIAMMASHWLLYILYCISVIHLWHVLKSYVFAAIVHALTVRHGPKKGLPLIDFCEVCEMIRVKLKWVKGREDVRSRNIGDSGK